MREIVRSVEKVLVGFVARHTLRDEIVLARASMLVKHARPQDFLKDKITGLFTIPDPRSYKMVDEPELVWNQKTNAGIDQLHLQGYGTAGLATVGFCYIGLTNTAITPAAGDTTLSGEIAVNGLSRAIGTYAHTGGTTTTTIDKTFTATGTQSAQAAALFNASSAGTMNHELTFTQRNLINGDTLQVTYTITLS